MKNNPTNLEEYKRLLWKYIVVVACVSLIVTASVLQCYNSELTLVCSDHYYLSDLCIAFGIYVTICTRYKAVCCSDTK